MTLYWVDVETTGLDHDKDAMIELGITSTDERLDILTQRSWVIRLEDDGLRAMNRLVLDMHGKSGLLGEARESRYDKKQIEREALSFLRGCKPGESPMCGSTVSFDREFLKVNMPELHAWFHYRNVDVSTVKNLARLWYPDLDHFEDRKLHRVKPDLEDSILELRYYRNAIFRRNGRDIARSDSTVADVIRNLDGS